MFERAVGSAWSVGRGRAAPRGDPSGRRVLCGVAPRAKRKTRGRRDSWTAQRAPRRAVVSGLFQFH